MKPATLISAILLALIAVAHLLRLLFQVDVNVGGFPVPTWMSLVAALFTGVLAILLIRENRR
jgi:hypothetical protein